MRGALLLILPLLAASCGDEGPTKVPSVLDAPAVPTDLTADVGERETRLAWEVSTVEGIALFRVYRVEGDDQTFLRLGEPAAAAWSDSGLVPGRTYTYRVTSFGTNGIESEPSAELSVTPGSIGLVIDNRADYTSDREVALSFIAPVDAAAVKVGDDSLLTGGIFEEYLDTWTWILPDGDGEKTVYARFRSEQGVESGLVADRIVLDTKAEILSLTEDSEGGLLEPGDTLRIVMETGEAGGVATVTIGAALTAEPLTWDGDAGVYRLERVITPDLSADGEVAVGAFVDRAGNEAAPQTTVSTVTIANNTGSPLPVTLSAPSPNGGDWISLEWTGNADLDFANYSIYRGDEPGVSGGAEDLVIGVISDREVTGLIDSLNLRDSTTYYYRVFVNDTEGNRSGSNVTGATTRNLAPVAAEGFEVSAVDSPSTSVRLTWSGVDLSTVHDFASYEIRRSTAEAVSRGSDLVALVDDFLIRSYVDETTFEATTYYYRIYVVDRGGLAAGSEISSTATTDLDPSFVTLGAPSVDRTNQNVILSWAPNGNPDFASYQIYWGASITQGGIGSYALLETINNQAVSGYVHYPVVTDLPFYVEYYLVVHDEAGNTTESNTVQAVFPPNDPPAISGIIEAPGETFAVVSFETNVPTIAWVDYSANGPSLNHRESDTDNYDVVHSVTLEGLAPATYHWYRITVEDESGAQTKSAVRYFVTLGGGG